MAGAPVRPAIADAPRHARVVRDSPAWFAYGAQRKREARRAHRCAECWSSLERPRAMYCSDRCRWRFHGRFFWDAARVVVMRRDRYTCQACHGRFRRRELEVDHIVEIAEGGAQLDLANLQTLCRSCHREKTSRYLRTRHSSRVPRSGCGAHLPPEAPEPDWFPA